MPRLVPEPEQRFPSGPQDQTGGAKWAFVAKWFVIQGLLNIFIYWWIPEGVLFPFDASSRYEARTFQSVDSARRERTIPYRLMQPRQQDGQFPLVVFLHGAGERGDDNLSQLKYLPEQMATTKSRKRFPCFLLAPQCNQNSAWMLDDQQKMIIDLIEQTIREQPAIDPTRIYLTGLSMGGSGTWRVAARRPELFAAAVPVCGAGDPLQAAALVHLPLWAVHGSADGVVPVRYTQEMIAAIRSLGSHPQFSELQGVGHDSWLFAYQDSSGILDWMFLQSRTSPPIVVPAAAQ